MGRLRELFAKYGKVAIAVHLSVSGLSISGFYLAIKNNVDVEGILQRSGLLRDRHRPVQVPEQNDSERVDASHTSTRSVDETTAGEQRPPPGSSSGRDDKLIMSSGGALVLAILCNKALLPVRIPITLALTPPIAKFLAKRKLYKAGRWS